MLTLLTHLVWFSLSGGPRQPATEAPWQAAPMVQADTTDWESPPLLEAEGELTSAAQIEPSLHYSDHHTLGVQVDVGVPDGLAGSLALSPLRWLRFNLAGLTNAAAAGVRLSVTIVPWHGMARPTLTIEGGHYFEGNLTSVFKLEGDSAQVLRRVSYDFASGQVGLELGNERIAFLVRAGVSYLSGSLAPTIGSDGVSSGTPQVRSLLPSLKLGVLLCFG